MIFFVTVKDILQSEERMKMKGHPQNQAPEDAAARQQLSPVICYAPETLPEVSPLGMPLETLLGQIDHGRILIPR